MAIKLTKAVVEREVAKPGTGDRLVYDETVPGFAVRLRTGRAAVYVFAYRLRGKSQKLTIDAVSAVSLEKARERARELRANFKDGGDPASDRRQALQRLLTVGELLEAYLADLEARADAGKKRGRRSSAAEFRRLSKGAIVPHLGNLEVKALDPERVNRWHFQFKGSPTTGNRAATVARAAYRFGQRQGLVERGPSPFEALVRFEETPKRERYTLAELELVGAALREFDLKGAIPPSASLAFRILCLTGLRRSEVLIHSLKARRTEGDALRWSDLDLEAGLLRLRHAKAGAREVVLGKPVVTVLRLARPTAYETNTPVCVGRAGGPLVAFENAIRRVFVEAGVRWKGCHALRRTFASVAAEQGHGEFLVGTLLGHRAATVTAGYVLAGIEPLRSAADRISGELEAALEGRSAAVVDIKSSKVQF